MPTGSIVPREIAGKQARCPEQAWPSPSLMETQTEGLDLSRSPRVNSLMPELLPDRDWTSEEASVFLRNMEGKMGTSMVCSRISTESLKG